MGERFAIESNALLLGGTDPFAVGEAERAEGSVDLHIPETAEFAFLVAAMGEGIDSSMHEGVIGGALCGRPAETEAFGGFEDTPPILHRIDCFFDSGHGS